MLATALPPVLPAPVAASASANAIATHSSGNGNAPDSFARMLDAADARRQAPATADKAPDAKPAPKAAAEKADDAAPTADTGAGSAASAPADGDAIDDGSAAATAGAGLDPGLLAPSAQATDAAALLAGLATLPRPATSDAAGAATAAVGLRAGLRRAGDANDAACTEAPRRVAADAKNATADTTTTAAAPRRASGAGTAGSGAEPGQGRDPFTALMRQAQADRGTQNPTTEIGTQRLQTAAARTTEAQPASVDGLTPGAAALAAPTGPGAAFAGAAPTVAHARLSAGPGSAEFAGQLGAQLTTFVREGVQHARLELHPLELGPVTVQIAIDGTQARVNLAAEHAATRQALEQAMPALAGSLRDAGLTLSGGGVFEQPRQAQPDNGSATTGGRQGSDARSGTGEHAGTSTGNGPARLADAPMRRRGVVDLVA